MLYTGMYCWTENVIEAKTSCKGNCRGDYDEGGFACSSYSYIKDVEVDEETGKIKFSVQETQETE